MVPIPPDKILRCFPAVLARALGGQQVVEALMQYHDDRMSFDDIAEYHGFPSHAQAKRIIDRAHEALREMGLWIPSWKERYTSSERHRSVVLDVKA